MTHDKQLLSSVELEAQTALELPQRQLLALVTVVITDILSGNVTKIDVSDINVANGICAAVLSSGLFKCDIFVH